MRNRKALVVRRPVAPCPISRSEFLVSAQDMAGLIMEQPIQLKPGDFKPDKDGRQAFGWKGRAKGTVQFGDETMNLSISVNIKCEGSEDATP